MQQYIKIFIIPYLYEARTCFGRHTAHHQEPKTILLASGFAYVKGRWTCGCWTKSVVVGSVRPDHDQQHCYHHAPTVKPEAATAVVVLLKMGVRTPKTC